jgi:hypothetical protein
MLFARKRKAINMTHEVKHLQKCYLTSTEKVVQRVNTIIFLEERLNAYLGLTPSYMKATTKKTTTKKVNSVLTHSHSSQKETEETAKAYVIGIFSFLRPEAS